MLQADHNDPNLTILTTTQQHQFPHFKKILLYCSLSKAVAQKLDTSKAFNKGSS